MESIFSLCIWVSFLLPNSTWIELYGLVLSCRVWSQNIEILLFKYLPDAQY